MVLSVNAICKAGQNVDFPRQRPFNDLQERSPGHHVGRLKSLELDENRLEVEFSSRESRPHCPYTIGHQLIVRGLAAATKNANRTKLAANLWVNSMEYL